MTRTLSGIREMRPKATMRGLQTLSVEWLISGLLGLCSYAKLFGALGQEGLRTDIFFRKSK